jgi:hypothetical protein
MRYPGPRRVASRTTPPEIPYLGRAAPPGQDTRPITHWGIEQAGNGPPAARGDYTLKMAVDGQTLSKPLHIALPPDARGSEADVQASVKLQLKVRDDISTAGDMTNQFEWMRRQIEDKHKTAQGKAELLKAMDAIDKKMKADELTLVTESDMLSTTSIIRNSIKLLLKLIWLGGEIGGSAGDVAGTGDYGATETDTAMMVDQKRQLQAVQV